MTSEYAWEQQLGIPEWEPHQMTICVAAMCNSGQTIVGASDRKIGIQFTSAEFDDSKFLSLFKDWSVAISGTVSNATEVILAARQLEPTLPSYASFDVMTAIEKAYRKVRVAKAEGKILAARGWTLADFQQYGSQRLPPNTYASIDTQLSYYDLEADLLIVGFGEDATSILSIKNPGVAADQSKLGFWCIGSGATLAQAAMFSRDYSIRFSTERAAYCVYKAKKIAERASGVGDEETDVFIIRPNGVTGLPQEIKDVLEKTYQKLKPQEMTPEQWHELTEAFAKL